MILTFKDLQAFEDWRYNLLLVAPTKGEAKKTVSQGFIRLQLWHDELYPLVQGYATDDILSIQTSLALTEITAGIGEGKNLWISPQNFKAAEPFEDCNGDFSVEIENDPAFDARFDERFWDEHVEDSINGVAKFQAEIGFTLNPDRFGKLGLLRPRGYPFSFEHVEWADRSILRWSGHSGFGIYTYGSSR
jgi:hypothetical protein